MRFVIALLTLVFAACRTTPVSQSQSQAASPGQGLASEEPKPSTDSPMEFLLRSAATDFHAHRPPVVERFRDVRFGHVKTPAGAKQYQLCGEFLPQQREGKAEWTPFVTIRRPALNNTLEFKLRAGVSVHSSYRIETRICRHRCRTDLIRCDRHKEPAQ